MGARERGQHRQKQHAKSGGSKYSPQVSHKKTSSSLRVSSPDPAFRAQALQGRQRYSNSTSPYHQNGFSLSEEARNTESHGQGFAFSTSLRGKGISFVSAGNLRMEEEETAVEEPTTRQPGFEGDHTDYTPALAVPEDDSRSADADTAVITIEEPKAYSKRNSERRALTGPLPPCPFPQNVEPILSDAGIDLEQDVPTISEKPKFRDRVASSSGESSAEEIVFTGRHKGTPVAATPPPTRPSTQQLKISPTPPPTPPPAPIATLGVPETLGQRRMNSRLRRQEQRGKSQRELDEEEAIIQDYIDNLAMDDQDEDETGLGEPPLRKNEHHHFYDGAAEENVKVRTLETRSSRRPEIDQAIDWSSSDLEDFDDISTTDVEIQDVAQILRRRDRSTGLQYLVSGVGTNTSDAKWILEKNLTSNMARKEIRVFEEIRQIERETLEEEMEDSSSDSEDDNALDDLIDKIGSEDIENARIMRRTAAMTDEQIALALAKQEELGMGGDEILLFDGQICEEDNNDDELSRGDNFVSFSVSKHTSNRTRSKKNKRTSDRFPSAGAFADALDEDPYGAFDVMDFDRPSLRPKPKGRKGDFPYELELEDEDLADTIRSTWSKDREKKAARKRERQEARTTALLDAAIGSDPGAIRGAIRAFLVREIDTLSLPVMPAHIRASVHRLAKALHLNSRSEGKGDDRHPILTKTARTTYYTIDTIWEIDALMNQRKFFPRNNGASFRIPKAPHGTTSGAARGRKGGGGAYSGASYMDGDVVGASAPEIGSENRGRAMLEKMGWSSGMAIGALGNKGRTDPIQHVVKNTKAGLG